MFLRLFRSLQFSITYNLLKYFVWVGSKAKTQNRSHSFSQTILKSFLVKHLLGLLISVSVSMIVYIYL